VILPKRFQHFPRDPPHIARSDAQLASHPASIVLAGRRRGRIAMDTITLSKSRAGNALEGLALSVICQAFPTFVSAAMMLQLAFEAHFIGDPIRPTVFVPLASLFSALLARWLGPKYPDRFKHAYEPAFFDAKLSFADKLATWRERPATSVQLVSNVTMLSVLAAALLSLG
jgi:hypothetical protein